MSNELRSADSHDSEWGQYDVDVETDSGEIHEVKHLASLNIQDPNSKTGTKHLRNYKPTRSEEDLLNASPEPINKTKAISYSQGMKRNNSSTGSFKGSGGGGGGGGINNKYPPDQKHLAMAYGSQSLHIGITSSPSFQELERAIGAQLALGMNSESLENLEYRGKGGYKPRSKNNSMNQLYRSPQSSPRHNNSHSLVAAARSELAPFINESESRALILLHSPSISPALVHDACQQCGVLYYMRPEFHSRGVTFLSYFDHRAAIDAHSNLALHLGAAAQASCHFSVMLHAANNCDESKLVLKKLATGMSEAEVEAIFSRYGLLLSIQRTFDGEGDSKFSNFIVEYFNIQDARLAVSELSATSAQIWGAETEITFSTLDSRKQKVCKQLLAVLSRWRGDAAAMQTMAYPSHIPPPPSPHHAQQHQMLASPGGGGGRGGGVAPGPFGMMMMMPSYPSQPGMYYPTPPPPQGDYSQYMTGPYHGGYGYPYADVSGGAGGAQGPPSPGADTYGMQPQLQPQPQQQQRAPRNNFYEDGGGGSTGHPSGRPQYHNGGHYGIAGASSGGGGGGGHSGPGQHQRQHQQKKSIQRNEPQSDSDFSLDENKLLNGAERRTTLMIRNIPNKYTQISVLEEINANHLGNYDFFYLPIDFKNRCNVGYAFINFSDPIHIVPFYKEFIGHKWKNFNSEKVCALTFARIQGKQSMVSRFQNSSLLDKDESYKPLLFVSSGPDKGKPEPFPVPGRACRRPKDEDRDGAGEQELVQDES